jgi:ATP-dependent Clp protease ATP-binding subunit ClpC
VDYETSKVMKRLTGQGITIELDEKAREFLIDKGYNPDFGARPLRRAIGTYIEDPMSEMLLTGGFKPPCKVLVTRKSDVAEGGAEKPQDHLFFQQIEGPPVAETKPEAPKPVATGTGG